MFRLDNLANMCYTETRISCRTPRDLLIIIFLQGAEAEEIKNG